MYSLGGGRLLRGIGRWSGLVIGVNGEGRERGEINKEQKTNSVDDRRTDRVKERGRRTNKEDKDIPQKQHRAIVTNKASFMDVMVLRKGWCCEEGTNLFLPCG